jgi:hypothetical protein
MVGPPGTRAKRGEKMDRDTESRSGGKAPGGDTHGENRTWGDLVGN